MLYSLSDIYQTVSGGQVLKNLKLVTHLVGALPIVNYYLDQLGIDELFEEAFPTSKRAEISHAKALGALLRNIILRDRHPLYSHAEWCKNIQPSLLKMLPEQTERLNDDRIGRSLDKVFDSDRAVAMTEIVRRAIIKFKINLKQLNNDSTTLTLSGSYEAADGSIVRGQPSLNITYGHNKDHRPDLKQLLFILTVSSDGAVPVHYRMMNGNTADVSTHIETWDLLRELTGNTSFLYVADCKLCSKKSLEHIAKNGGRFITILPRNRREDKWFRNFVQFKEPLWEIAISRTSRRGESAPKDIWKVTEAELPTSEGYRVIWIWSSLKAIEDSESRQGRIEKAHHSIGALNTRLNGKRSRIRERVKVLAEAEKIISICGVKEWAQPSITEIFDETYKQEKNGRPGPKTKYVKTVKSRFTVSLTIIQSAIESTSKSDGIFPLISNCKDLTPSQILASYKFQPQLEKRYEQLKTVQDLTPVWLKNVTRIESLMFLYFVSLLVHALMERDLRNAMKKDGLTRIPIYPEERLCPAPTADRIIEIFSRLQRNEIHGPSGENQIIYPSLDSNQKLILGYLNISNEIYKK